MLSSLDRPRHPGRPERGLAQPRGGPGRGGGSPRVRTERPAALALKGSSQTRPPGAAGGSAGEAGGREGRAGRGASPSRRKKPGGFLAAGAGRRPSSHKKSESKNQTTKKKPRLSLTPAAVLSPELLLRFRGASQPDGDVSPRSRSRSRRPPAGPGGVS